MKTSTIKTMICSLVQVAVDIPRNNDTEESYDYLHGVKVGQLETLATMAHGFDLFDLEKEIQAIVKKTTLSI